MPERPKGVYPAGRGGWYVKVTVGRGDQCRLELGRRNKSAVGTVG